MSRIDTDWVKKLEDTVDNLKARVESLEQRILVVGSERRLGPNPRRGLASPYDLGAIARAHKERIKKYGR